MSLIIKTSILQIHMHAPSFKRANNIIKISRMSHMFKVTCILALTVNETQAHLQ